MTETKTVLTALRGRLEALYGPRLAGLSLFGSHARGDHLPDSDIDLLVVLKGSVNPGEEIARAGPITAALSLEHGLTISCVFISEERLAGERSPFLLNVRREGIPV